LKYAMVFVFLMGCDWSYQERVVEDVVETIVKDETGIDLHNPHSKPSVEFVK